MNREIKVGERIVGEYVGDTVVFSHREKNHKRTYVWHPGQNRMTVTVGNRTEEIPSRPG
jgi:hypothetical protein